MHSIPEIPRRLLLQHAAATCSSRKGPIEVPMYPIPSAGTLKHRCTQLCQSSCYQFRRFHAGRQRSRHQQLQNGRIELLASGYYSIMPEFTEFLTSCSCVVKPSRAPSRKCRFPFRVLGPYMHPVHQIQNYRRLAE